MNGSRKVVELVEIRATLERRHITGARRGVKIVYHPAQIIEWLLPKFFSLLICAFQPAGLAGRARNPLRGFCAKHPVQWSVSQAEKVES